MNNRGHLPAGQVVQGGAGADMTPTAPNGVGSVPVPPVPGPAVPSGVPGSGMGPGPGSRRGGRPQNHYPPAHHWNQHHVNHMYTPGYVNPYTAPYYMHHQPYQAAYHMPYQHPHAVYTRSPPAMQHFVPMHQQTYVRPPQHSPIVSSSYHHPPIPPSAPPATIPPPQLPHTPSSTHSHVVPPPPMTPPVPVQMAPQQRPEPVQQPAQPAQQAQQQPQQETQTPATQVQPPVAPPSQPEAQPQTAAQPTPAPEAPVKTETPLPSPAPVTPVCEPFRPPLPWYSVPKEDFPLRTNKRKKKKQLAATSEGVELPELPAPAAEASVEPEIKTEEAAPEPVKQPEEAPAPKAETKTEALPPRSETPSTQDQPSEDTTSTSPTTPSSVQPAKPSSTVTPASSATSAAKPTARPAVPAVPVLPVLPKVAPKEAKPAVPAEKRPEAAAAAAPAKPAEATAPQVNGSVTPEKKADETKEAATQPAQAPQPVPAPAPAKPKLWAGLFAKSSSSASATSSQVRTNGNTDGQGVASGPGAFSKANANSLAEAILSYQPGTPEKLYFLEPRGLVNTGNMCYMNSVLQVLLFCTPFYDFLDQVSKKAAHSFKSETPLLDTMIMFMREFKAIASASTAELLRKRLRPEEYEKYGDPFTPEFVYDTIRKLPRFSSMRRGHQQDAQEFLGFLLEGLHDECSQVTRNVQSTVSTTANSSVSSPTAAAEGGNDWLEVGPRQRSAITRSSGYSQSSSPITKIFGGQLRSELRVPGNKNSVTLEPYQPLQLDIGAPEVRTIIDALKGLTHPEAIYGDFNSPRGKDVRATKQVFIESVPPVLILHLKRFQFDAEGYGGTVKIWKKVGYPLEFDFPREVLSRSTRNSILNDNTGAPRYRLIAVVYHHGKNASGGHYTVDVRRQDGKEWIRIDDTVIRRVRDEEVAAEGGAEEEPSLRSLATADGKRDGGVGASANRFAGMDEDAGDGDEGGWKQAAGGKKWSSVVNGGGAQASTNGLKSKQPKESVRENKVAYLLFYQRI
ncbi:ubiquitin carboxyl-terminal hydrolase-like protein [Thermochaetoides thermophila DSM 1495]|uniref:ubiquitinyl hydrolase 1 n=1 Tax=Chaetomium thermophilum (strain DSM 1495 / CBS 144.50 / IMI 039719) TaxID=759272 RepID=G0SEF8_CHATD|nr:ubiquitin carboxyl-terminal hydrolase-like protein [Thermochaetoides thermophila DSM 1495]EGS18335.1 ubiquitin carboxyl-terminal hydrolase-like protein [Thermochaetoides thermophila DSM 1495]